MLSSKQEDKSANSVVFQGLARHLGIPVGYAGWWFGIICLLFSSIFFWGQLPQTAFHPQNWWYNTLFYGVSYGYNIIPLGFPEITLIWGQTSWLEDSGYFIDTESPRTWVSCRAQCETVSGRVLSERYCKINCPLIISIPRAASMTKKQVCIPHTITLSKIMF